MKNYLLLFFTNDNKILQKVSFLNNESITFFPFPQGDNPELYLTPFSTAMGYRELIDFLNKLDTEYILLDYEHRNNHVNMKEEDLNTGLTDSFNVPEIKKLNFPSQNRSKQETSKELSPQEKQDLIDEILDKGYENITEEDKKVLEKLSAK